MLVRVDDIARVEVEPEAVDVQARRVVEIAVGARSPLDSSAIRYERAVRETFRIGEREAEVGHVISGDVVPERVHVTDRGTHAVAREERPGVERLYEHVTGRFGVERDEELPRDIEQALVLGADLPFGVIIEARMQLLEGHP